MVEFLLTSWKKKSNVTDLMATAYISPLITSVCMSGGIMLMKLFYIVFHKNLLYFVLIKHLGEKENKTDTQRVPLEKAALREKIHICSIIASLASLGRFNHIKNQQISLSLTVFNEAGLKSAWLVLPHAELTNTK